MLKAGEPADDPAGDRSALRNALLSSAVDLGSGGPDNTFGYGRLNAAAAGAFCDRDDDGVLDSADNCPAVANASQVNTDATNPAANRPGADMFGDACDADIDGDGYTNAVEIGLGKDPLTYCAKMRADVDGDHAISILDISQVAMSFGQTVPPAPERRKQDADNAITILDLSRQASLFGQSIASCP